MKETYFAILNISSKKDALDFLRIKKKYPQMFKKYGIVSYGR